MLAYVCDVDLGINMHPDNVCDGEWFCMGEVGYYRLVGGKEERERVKFLNCQDNCLLHTNNV